MIKNHKKNILFRIKIINSLLIGLFIYSNSFTQTVYNNGTTFSALNGVKIFVEGTVLNNTGSFSIQTNNNQFSEIKITENFENNSIADGSGIYRIHGNWINNSIFNSNSGSVYLEGSNQLLTGNTSTSFYNLVLSGNGIKTLTLNQYVDGVLNLNDRELQTQEFAMFVTNTNINAIQLTTGFVSSSLNGFLSRNTASANAYLFPVGSSVGTLRYRPAEITPISSEANTYTVRMANIDATSEGFDRNLTDETVCQTNPLFFHNINRTVGTSAISLRVYYDASLDGTWEGIANWSLSPNQWQSIDECTNVSTSPLSYVQANNWNSFVQTPYILYNSSPIVTIEDAGPFCDNQQDVLLNATPLGGVWTGAGITDSNLGVFSPSIAGAGTHTITYEIDNGACAGSSQIVIIVNVGTEINITSVPIVCANSMPFTLSATPIGGIWSGTGITNSNSGTFSPVTAGVGLHTIYYNVSGECNVTDSIIIEVASVPNVILTGIKETCSGAADGSVISAVTNGTLPYSYTWNTGANSLNITYVESGSYSLTVTDNNSCIATASFVLTDPNIPCVQYPNHIYIPTIFSPNGDGENDILYVRGENIESIEWYIYNRWGNRVFKTTNSSKGWDGTYKGTPVEPGVFVYIVRGTYTDNKKFEKQGSITLVR